MLLHCSWLSKLHMALLGGSSCCRDLAGKGLQAHHHKGIATAFSGKPQKAGIYLGMNSRAEREPPPWGSDPSG